MKRFIPIIISLSFMPQIYAASEINSRQNNSSSTETLYRSLRKQAVQKRIRISDYPAQGAGKALVILAEFEDVKFTTEPDALTYFNALLNDEGFSHENGADGSARDYYIESSFGSFQPDFIVVGPVTMPNKSAYYGEDAYGWLDVKAHEMVAEACRMVDEMIDFSEFDLDGDGEVDNIYLFYAGLGQSETMEAPAIWPQSNMLYDTKDYDLTLDGVRINHYAYSNELTCNATGKPQPVGIGTFVHEFGHVLGISNHYDSTFAGKRPGVDNWDTMAAANYFNNMHTPPLFSAFERAELGWLEYTELTADDSGSLLTLPPLQESNMAYRVTVDLTDGKEYFILENRQQTGWDKFLPGHGMLVWHIDMNEEAWLNNQVNTDSNHNRVDIIEADGYESLNNLEGDPFPGKRKVSDFAFTAWSGDETFHLTEISENEDGEISFKFYMPDDDINGIDRLISSPESIPAQIFDLMGNRVDEDYHGITIRRQADGSVQKIVKK